MCEKANKCDGLQPRCERSAEVACVTEAGRAVRAGLHRWRLLTDVSLCSSGGGNDNYHQVHGVCCTHGTETCLVMFELWS